MASGTNFVVYSWEFSPVTEMKDDDAIIRESYLNSELECVARVSRF